MSPIGRFKKLSIFAGEPRKVDVRSGEDKNRQVGESRYQKKKKGARISAGENYLRGEEGRVLVSQGGVRLWPYGAGGKLREEDSSFRLWGSSKKEKRLSLLWRPMKGGI